jgi:hypothetical protein
MDGLASNITISCGISIDYFLRFKRDKYEHRRNGRCHQK